VLIEIMLGTHDVDPAAASTDITVSAVDQHVEDGIPAPDFLRLGNEVPLFLFLRHFKPRVNREIVRASRSP
jgi:hypothetical protein